MSVNDSGNESPYTTKIASIVLTGGPCGGKTTAMSIVTEYLRERGYIVYTVPEVPTILFTNGASYPGEDISRRKELLTLETTILTLQLTMEESFKAIANSTGKKCVILCDRGVLDCKAYMPPDVWLEVLKIMQTDAETLLSRYAAVCHLTTAADGAADYYTTDNNPARTETSDQALVLDKKTQSTWTEHSVHEIIHNADRTFAEKLDITKKFVLDQVEKTIGKPDVSLDKSK